MRRNFRGLTVRIEVKNPQGVSKGVKSLAVDRRAVMGNLVPLERLREGSRIVALMG